MASTNGSHGGDAGGGGFAGLERRVWVVSGVIVLGTIMSILDTTIVNVALDTLARRFHTSLSTIQWVSTGYLLALATSIPVTGWAIVRVAGRTALAFAIIVAIVIVGAFSLVPHGGREPDRAYAQTLYPAVAR